MDVLLCCGVNNIMPQYMCQYFYPRVILTYLWSRSGCSYVLFHLKFGACVCRPCHLGVSYIEGPLNISNTGLNRFGCSITIITLSLTICKGNLCTCKVIFALL